MEFVQYWFRRSAERDGQSTRHEAKRAVAWRLSRSALVKFRAGPGDRTGTAATAAALEVVSMSVACKPRLEPTPARRTRFERAPCSRVCCTPVPWAALADLRCWRGSTGPVGIRVCHTKSCGPGSTSVRHAELAVQDAAYPVPVLKSQRPNRRACSCWQGHRIRRTICSPRQGTQCCVAAPCIYASWDRVVLG